MRFCTHFAHMSLSGIVEKNFLFDFERYDLTNGRE
jgi:hypothetical protein